MATQSNILKAPDQTKASESHPRAESIIAYFEALDRQCRRILIEEARAGDTQARQMLKEARAARSN